MKGKKQVFLQHPRLYSEEFKRARVKDYESGTFTVVEMGRLYNISDSMIYRWIYKYSTYNKKKIRVVELEESGYKKVKDLQNRIKELERIIGQKQLNIDFLEKMIEIAKEEFGIDIKKNFNTPHSDGSADIEKKQDTN
jgi:transposase